MAEDAGVFQDIDDDHHADQEHDRVGALLAAIRDHKPDFIHALTVWPGTDTLRRHTLERCRPLTPAALTPAARSEAETLATELATSGGLGHFICDLFHIWHALSDRDRLAAAYAWELATGAHTEGEAA